MVEVVGRALGAGTDEEVVGSDRVDEREVAEDSATAMARRVEDSVGDHAGVVASVQAGHQTGMVEVQTVTRRVGAVGHVAISGALEGVEALGRDTAQARADHMTVQEAPKLAADSKLKSSFSPISF